MATYGENIDFLKSSLVRFHQKLKKLIFPNRDVSHATSRADKKNPKFWIFWNSIFLKFFFSFRHATSHAGLDRRLKINRSYFFFFSIFLKFSWRHVLGLRVLRGSLEEKNLWKKVEKKVVKIYCRFLRKSSDLHNYYGGRWKTNKNYLSCNRPPG